VRKHDSRYSQILPFDGKILILITISGLVSRAGEAFIAGLVDEEPAVMIEGPRGSGKSTILRAVARRMGGSVVDLDDEATLAEIRAGSEAALTSDRLVAIDEFQRAPEVLSTVKRVVDRQGGVSRFLLAGSVSDRLLPRGTETLTGRVQRVTLLPLAAGEVLGQPCTWLAQVLDGEGSVPNVRTELRRDAVFELVAAGGFPGALRRHTPGLQRRWLNSYLSTVADRDLPAIADVRNAGAIERLFRLSTERSAQSVNLAEMAQRLEIKNQTVRSYLTLLERCYLIAELPAWTVGISARAARRSKLHVLDTGLAAASLNADARKLSRLPFGGSLVESFVVAELRKQAAVLDEPLSFAHFRDHGGIEVDLVVERPDGTVLAIEVKSSTVTDRSDARGLRFLRDALGSRFIAGVVFHTGPLTVNLGDRIWATPIPAMWGGGGDVPGATGLGSDRTA
jgi:uncharacterized protein